MDGLSWGGSDNACSGQADGFRSSYVLAKSVALYKEVEIMYFLDCGFEVVRISILRGYVEICKSKYSTWVHRHRSSSKLENCVSCDCRLIDHFASVTRA